VPAGRSTVGAPARSRSPPYDPADPAQFYAHNAPIDRVRAYGCFGGIPAYLRFWEADRSLEDQVEATLLTPGHFLFREGEELLRTEFHQEALYASILRAVATGQHRPSDIARAVGRHSADEIFDHLRRLQALHFLRREVPVTEWDRPRTQRVQYRLADPYLRFWFRYVLPFQSFLQLGRGDDLWVQEIAPTLDEFVARTTWEEVCVQHLWRRQAEATLSARFAQLGRWWDNEDEIDLVGMWGGRVTIVGECKWTSSLVDTRVFADLQRKAPKLPLGDQPLWVLASRSGFCRDIRERAATGRLMLIEPTEFFADQATVR
jgi:AAA+ ATPase superfamily predicted ATPase